MPEARQHNTYDIEFYGPNSMISSVFYAAMKAGAEMAEFMEDAERAKRYRTIWQRGSQKMDELLWQGEYYVSELF